MNSYEEIGRKLSHNSPGHRLYSHSEAMKKKQDKLREQREQEEEKRLKRVPVAPPQHFDAVKYQQKLLERARKIDTARKRQEDKAQQLAQGHAFCLLLCKSINACSRIDFSAHVEYVLPDEEGQGEEMNCKS